MPFLYLGISSKFSLLSAIDSGLDKQRVPCRIQLDLLNKATEGASAAFDFLIPGETALTPAVRSSGGTSPTMWRQSGYAATSTASPAPSAARSAEPPSPAPRRLTPEAAFFLQRIRMKRHALRNVFARILPAPNVAARILPAHSVVTLPRPRTFLPGTIAR